MLVSSAVRLRGFTRATLRAAHPRNDLRLQLRALTTSTHCRTEQLQSARSNSQPKTYSVPFAYLALGAAAGLAIGYFAYTQPSTASSSTIIVKYGSRDQVKTAIAELTTIFGAERVLTNPEAIYPYGYSDNSYHGGLARPVIPHVVNVARKFRVPLTVFSGGTSLEGHYGGHEAGSICIDMSRMDQIIEIHEKDSDLICQAGASWEHINEILEEKGIPLFFPLDPGPGATIGGMIGTGCSGTNAVRYGTAKGEWFLNLTVVLPNGEVIKTRRRAHKSSAGFDLTKLFVGAEGTLGVITEATLKLAPRLPTRVAIAQFPSVEHAVSAVQEILHSDIGMTIRTSLTRHHKSYALFLKIQGSDDMVKRVAAVVRKIVQKHGASGWDFGSSEEAAKDLWHARKSALWSTLESLPNSRAWTTDVCVPPSNLPQLVKETKEDLKAHNVKGTIVGHVGDGNFHAILLFRNDEELEAVREAVHRMVHRALRLDGTCTGEHGIGIGKKEYLVEELGPGTIELMKTIKAAVDPLCIMNPGKLYPDEDTSWKSLSR
ncbi:D-lactate dehydrogenase cytochrome oxidoreductase [Auriculariales sp. MPI-PUGE-AT-0066]|nr:D-lactate dehydrogenase cytochrome oxidoreductase [Auriculariales sp. MPI-PUGE-AT-0066]